MLLIRDIQLAAIGEQAREGFEKEAYQHALNHWPEQLAMRGDRWVRALVTSGVDKADSHGIDEREDVMAFLEIVFQHGLDFDKSPSRPWAPTILNMGNPGHLKIKQLQRKLSPATHA
jgi:hypothetical protein